MRQAPGPIDLHTHGAGRYDSRSGRPEDVQKLAAAHGEAGVEGILVAVYAAPIEGMRRAMSAVAGAMHMPVRQHGARILGVHLEGPFLSPARAGAQNQRAFLKPSLPCLKRLLKGYEDMVRVITIAPELPGAVSVIKACAERGIRVNMGHSDATYRQALRGKAAGATGVTHLFNAMRPFHHREPGLAGLGLLDPDLYVEVIADGVHVAPPVLKLVFDLKAADRILLVSDSVKGPMRKRGVLQGAKKSVPQAEDVLRSLGVPERSIIRAARLNPVRYLRDRPGRDATLAE